MKDRNWKHFAKIKITVKITPHSAYLYKNTYLTMRMNRSHSEIQAFLNKRRFHCQNSMKHYASILIYITTKLNECQEKSQNFIT